MDPCALISCTAPETCVNGVCKCGNMPTCQNRRNGNLCVVTGDTGDCICGTSSKNITACPASTSASNYCDTVNAVCKCTASLATCDGMSTGAYCDITANNGNGICKCSQSVDACVSTSNNPKCLNDVCKCGTSSSSAVCTGTEKCDADTCKGRSIY